MSDSPSWIHHTAITLALLIGVRSSAAAQRLVAGLDQPASKR